MIRSPFFYVGDKYKLTPNLREVFPEHINTLIEPFCGGGSVFLNIKADNYIANDNDKYIIKLHKFLKSNASKQKSFFKKLESLIIKYKLSASVLGIFAPDELKKKYIKTYYAKFNKESYKKLKADFNKNKNDMFLLYLLLVYGFNHMLRFNNRREFNLPVGNVDYNKNVKKALSDYFNFMKNNRIKFMCKDYLKFLGSININKNDLVYCDPPYLITSSEYNKNWLLSNEKRLLNILDDLNKKKIKFALSNVFKHKGRENTTLMNWAKKYNVYHIKANYISYHDNTQKKSDEVIITNF